MRAKDYFERFEKAHDRSHESMMILKDFLLEIDKMCKMRQVKYDRGIIPILMELNDKWIKFALMVNNKLYPVTGYLHTGAFISGLKSTMPEVYQYWIKSTNEK